MADREIGRREMVEKTVDYICRQLSRLKVIEGLPDAKIESETLINRATDVLSGALTYLAVYITREPGVFGVLGRLTKLHDSLTSRKHRQNHRNGGPGVRRCRP